MADIEAIERVPLAERLQGRSTSWEIIEFAALSWPDRAALRAMRCVEQTGELRCDTLTYSQLRDGVDRIAAQVRKLGCGRGDVVAVMMPNLVETHLALWGAQAAAVAFPVNWMLESAKIASLLTAAGARLLIAPVARLDAEVHAKACEVASLLSGQVRLAEIERDLLVSDACGPRVSRCVQGLPREEDIASIFHTGGTTGLPKLAPHTHRNEAYNSWATAIVCDFQPGDVLLCGLPMFHVNAVIVTGLAAFQAGATVLLAGARGFRDASLLDRFWDIVEQEKVSFFSGVPTIFAALLTRSAAGRDLSSLRFAICGAAPMSAGLIGRFENYTGVRLLEGYGLTEGTCVSAINPRDGERRLGSVGLRLPYQPMKCIKVDAEENYLRDCGDDEHGLVVISGPNVFPGYLGSADQLPGPGGWLSTGDLGARTADGYFRITGRAKDVIIRGGHNIDPSEVEAALLAHPAIEQAAVVGQIDSRTGELPVAFIVAKSGLVLDEDAKAQIAAHLRGRVSERAALPARIVSLEAMPLTGVGKIFKPELRRLAAIHAIEALLSELPTIERDDLDLEIQLDQQGALELTLRLRRSEGKKSLASAEEALATMPIPIRSTATTAKSRAPK